MGKVEGYIEFVARINPTVESDGGTTTSGLYVLAKQGENLLRHGVATEGALAAADELRHLEVVKEIAKGFGEALNEQIELRKDILHSQMLEEELPTFERRGKTYFLDHTTYVQARKELGGTENPDLIGWLETEDLGAIAKRNVNAATLRSAINEWRGEHDVDEDRVADILRFDLELSIPRAQITLDDEGNTVADESVADRQAANREFVRTQLLGIASAAGELGEDQQDVVEAAARVAALPDAELEPLVRHYQLHQLMKITSVPTVGSRKAKARS